MINIPIKIVIAVLIAASLLGLLMDEARADIIYLKNNNQLEGLIRQMNDREVVLATPLGTLSIEQEKIKGYEIKEYEQAKLERYPVDEGLWLPEHQLSMQTIISEVSAYRDEVRAEYVRRYLKLADSLFHQATNNGLELRMQINLQLARYSYEIVLALSSDNQLKWHAQKLINAIDKELEKYLRLPGISDNISTEDLLADINKMPEAKQKELARSYLEKADEFSRKSEAAGELKAIYEKSAMHCYYLASQIAADEARRKQAAAGYKKASLKLLEAARKKE